MASNTSIDINVDWNAIHKQIGEEFVKEFDETFMLLVRGEIDKFVPFLTGQLALTSYVPKVTSVIEGGKIIYPANYAVAVYERVNGHFTKDSHPNARAEWDKGISEDEYEQMVQRAAKKLMPEYLARVGKK